MHDATDKIDDEIVQLIFAKLYWFQYYQSFVGLTIFNIQ